MEDLESEGDIDLAALIAAARERWAEVPRNAVRNTAFGVALVAVTFIAWLVLRPDNSEQSTSVIALNGVPELEVHAATPAADRKSNIATPDARHTTTSPDSAAVLAATSTTEPAQTSTSRELAQKAILASPDGVETPTSTSPPASTAPPSTAEAPTTRPPTTPPPFTTAAPTTTVEVTATTDAPPVATTTTMAPTTTTTPTTTTQQPTTTVHPTTTVIDTTTTLATTTTTTEFCIRIRRRPPKDWCWKDRRD